MKRIITVLLLAVLSMAVGAQSGPREELLSDVSRSAGNCLVYPGPSQQKLTPAPKGYRPFYLSHFGRHGSRYMINTHDYNNVVDILQRAHLQGKLSALGEDVLGRVRTMQGDAADRLGELTELGIEQQKGIARRMAERFPSLFKGQAVVDAHSTMVLRCVFSMENALQQLLAINPRLRISHTASHEDMHTLNYIDKDLTARVTSKAVKQAYDRYCREHQCWQRPVGSLFADTAYLAARVNGERLNYYLFRMAGSVQNTHLSGQLTLYDLYTPDEIYKNWQMENAYWFLGYGHTTLNGGQQPYTQRRLLRRIIAQADSCIALGNPGVQLRFSHETALLPLVCLMDINGFGQTIDDLNQLEERGWVGYRVFPMSGNIQLVFYRRHQADGDVLVKVLLNEDEARLPLQAYQDCYYRWSDVRSFWLKKLEGYTGTN